LIVGFEGVYASESVEPFSTRMLFFSSTESSVGGCASDGGLAKRLREADTGLSNMAVVERALVYEKGNDFALFVSELGVSVSSKLNGVAWLSDHRPMTQISKWQQIQ